jgi:hypothetical protein
MPFPNPARQLTFKIAHQNGFTTEILPGIPLDAVLREGSTVREHQRGKVPGKRNGDGTWSGFTGRWSLEQRTREQDLTRWQKWKANVCLQARMYPGCDIDCEDEHTAATIAELAERHLGAAPTRYREGSGRRLRMYCVAGDPIKKHRLAWKDANNNVQAVELLGLGQQFLVGGLHPSGKPYVWDDLPSAFDLTPITVEQVAQFFVELEKLVCEAGYELVAGAIRAGAGAGGSRRPIGDASLQAPSAQHVLELLKAWPNTAENVPSHDDFVPAMAAIKSALGANAEAHYADVIEWALGYDGNDEAYVQKVWGSINDSAIGWEWLAGRARPHGYDGDVQTDFTEGAPTTPDTPYDQMMDRYVWVQDLGRYNDTRGGGFLGSREFNAANVTVKPFGVTGQQTAEALFQNAAEARKVSTATCRPGEPVITRDQNERGVDVAAVNLWRPSTSKPKLNATSADVAPWFDLVERLFGPEGADEREHFLNWWAYLLQHPGRKIGHAIVIIGGQGVGKDTVLTPLFDAVGQHNVAPVDGQTLAGQWTYFLKAQVVYVQELANARRDFYNQLKPYISGQKSRLAVNEKGLRQYFVPNHQNWLFTSNSDTALAPDEDDRRFWVHRVLAEEPPAPEYFDKLHAWFEQGGTECVFGWLLQRDVSAFNPMAKPPTTAAKRAMIDQAQPAGVRWVREQFAEGGAFTGRSIVTATELTRTTEQQWNAPADLNSKHVLSAFRLEGFKPAHRVRIGKDMRQLWAKDGSPLLAQLSAEKMRERYLAEMGDGTKEAAA